MKLCYVLWLHGLVVGLAWVVFSTLWQIGRGQFGVHLARVSCPPVVVLLGFSWWTLDWLTWNHSGQRRKQN